MAAVVVAGCNGVVGARCMWRDKTGDVDERSAVGDGRDGMSAGAGMGAEVDGEIHSDSNSDCDCDLTCDVDIGIDSGVDIDIDFDFDPEMGILSEVRDELANCKKRCHASLSVRNVVSDLTLRC